MPSRFYARKFVANYYYHIYNRGSRKQNIFLDQGDYFTFLEIISYYLRFPTGKPLSKWFSKKQLDLTEKVRNLPENNSLPLKCSFEISAYCLMPNHFHLLVKQKEIATKETGISNFMRRLSITYAMYFCKKYTDHSGNLFQGRYKNIIVDNDSQLIYLSKYIHLNPAELIKTKGLENYPYSSYSHFINSRQTDWINSTEILKFFSNINPKMSYQVFVEDKNDFPSYIETLSLENK